MACYLGLANTTEAATIKWTTDDVTVTSRVNDVINYSLALDDVNKMTAFDSGLPLLGYSWRFSEKIEVFLPSLFCSIALVFCLSLLVIEVN